MGYISLIIGLVIIYITVKFDKKLYDPDESMYQNVNKIGVWVFSVFCVIGGIIIIIKDIIHFFNL